MVAPFNIAVGLDLHKRFILATVLWQSGQLLQERFDRTKDGLFSLKTWILDHHADVVACESTSDYWVPVYDLLDGIVPVLVGNACDIKAFSHKKTDKIDSAMIARLALHDMIPPSRVFPLNAREFRKQLRLRHMLVQKRTDIKNQIHHILDSEVFRLSAVLSDLFGTSGRILLQGLINGMPVDDLIPMLPSRIRKREVDLRAVLSQTLAPASLFRLQLCLRLIRCMDDQIDAITTSAKTFAYAHHPREMAILRSVPGIGEISALTLLAEIGDIRDFPSGEKLASWLGLVPRVAQSADTLRTGSITKRGSIHARWILTEVAHAAARARTNRLRDFFERKKKALGPGKTIVALARKIATLIWHLLTHDEVYKDAQYPPKKEPHRVAITVPKNVTLEELLQILVDANVYLTNKEPD